MRHWRLQRGRCNEGKPSFSERGGTALAVGDSRRVWLIGKTPQRSAHASMQGTLMSQRVLYPPPQAVPLLPHGRRLFSAVGACGFVA